MHFPLLRPNSLLLLSVLFFTSCQTPAEKELAEKKLEKAQNEADQAKDPAIVSFIGRLRKAVANRDVRTLSTMMTADFGYNWTPGSDGFGCFQYWDENQLWPELQRIVSTQFLPNKNYFVAPPEFSMDPNYAGFRAGITQQNGRYKFAYFVPAKEVPMAPPPAPGN